LKASIPKIKCPTCDGRGEIDIPKHLFDTLQIVKRIQPATSSKVLHNKSFKDKVVLSAVTNRLDDLFRLGLLERSRCGRAWLYTVKT